MYSLLALYKKSISIWLFQVHHAAILPCLPFPIHCLFYREGIMQLCIVSIIYFIEQENVLLGAGAV